ncbi:hypothetical protein C0T31_10950 [Dysgonamonadaceae bacterium]|nr:hypothetical protein C0T31_10950 [Dysgonamonadaceae bacterium]
MTIRSVSNRSFANAPSNEVDSNQVRRKYDANMKKTLAKVLKTIPENGFNSKHLKIKQIANSRI